MLDKKTFEEALADFEKVALIFENHQDVILPEEQLKLLRTEGGMKLEYGLDAPVPIDDLEVDDKGVSATLMFGEESHKTYVPWDAVFGFVTKDKRIKKKERPKLCLVP